MANNTKNILKWFGWSKMKKGIYQRKTCFSKVFSINESALWHHDLKTKNPYQMAMDDPIKIIFVPLNFILQGISDKNKK